MTLAQNIISEILDIYNRAKDEYSKRSKELSINEREIQDILHRIEFEEFNSTICFSAVLKLKCLRVTRRKLKNELAQLQTFLDMLDSQHLNKIQQRINIQVNKQESRQYEPHVLSSKPEQAVNS